MFGWYSRGILPLTWCWNGIQQVAVRYACTRAPHDRVQRVRARVRVRARARARVRARVRVRVRARVAGVDLPWICVGLCSPTTSPCVMQVLPRRESLVPLARALLGAHQST